MQNRVRLLPSRSSTIGGPVLFVAGLAFLSVGLYYLEIKDLPSSDLLVSLGLLAAGLGSTILIYMRRVSVRVIIEKRKEGDQNRFRIILADPGGQIPLKGDLTQTKELRISPRSGAVFFLRLPGNIYLEVHRFSSRREAGKKFIKIENLQKDCILPAQSEPPVPHLQKRTHNRLSILADQRTVIWSDPVALETSIPLAVFLAAMVYLVLHGLEIPLDALLRGAIFGALALITVFGGLVSSSVRYIRMETGRLETGRFLLRYRLRNRKSLDEFSSFLQQKEILEKPGTWQLWREEVFPTAELRLYPENDSRARPIKRIRLHSSLAASVSIFQNLQSLYGHQPPVLLTRK
ncbi:MAG TPA: hypothetical protein DEA96_12575 [Leptospiraceae bacterium]|nr:hypothetical protein [Spirochaetaceae bacterium]HBS05797.1 hypothetical protein [Leptospiraceae bacterium]|tara:strand:- start:132361 stop:133404 length:1044 start_codon:yes stop_codon:yes gene_type:complete